LDGFFVPLNRVRLLFYHIRSVRPCRWLVLTETCRWKDD
jgi:hypothetical protein